MGISPNTLLTTLEWPAEMPTLLQAVEQMEQDKSDTLMGQQLREELPTHQSNVAETLRGIGCPVTTPWMPMLWHGATNDEATSTMEDIVFAEGVSTLGSGRFLCWNEQLALARFTSILGLRQLAGMRLADSWLLSGAIHLYAQDLHHERSQKFFLDIPFRVFDEYDTYRDNLLRALLNWRKNIATGLASAAAPDAVNQKQIVAMLEKLGHEDMYHGVIREWPFGHLMLNVIGFWEYQRESLRTVMNELGHWESPALIEGVFSATLQHGKGRWRLSVQKEVAQARTFSCLVPLYAVNSTSVAGEAVLDMAHTADKLANTYLAGNDDVWARGVEIAKSLLQ